MATLTHNGSLQVAKYLLSPLIWSQGFWLRRKDSELSEPAGTCYGQWRHKNYQPNEEVPPLRLLILGDSSAAGVGASHQDHALVGQLLHALKLSYKAIDWWIIAKNNATCKSTLKHLKKRPTQQFDVVVTSLGINDTSSGVAQQTFERELQELVDLLRDKYQAQSVVLSGLPQVSRFPNLPRPVRWYLGSKASAMDTGIQKIAQVKDCEYLDLSIINEQRLLASDGFHPGHDAYKIWGLLAAQATLTAIEQQQKLQQT